MIATWAYLVRHCCRLLMIGPTGRGRAAHQQRTGRTGEGQNCIKNRRVLHKSQPAHRPLAWPPSRFPLKITARGAAFHAAVMLAPVLLTNGTSLLSLNAFPSPMLRKLSAGCLLLLVVSPFTAPFSTCDLATLLGSASTQDGTPVAPLGSSTTSLSADTTASLVPPVTTAARHRLVRLVTLEGRGFSSASADSRPGHALAEPSTHAVAGRAGLSTILRL